MDSTANANGNPSHDNSDVWKVVQKPRRQRKGGKEKHHDGFRQQDGGSRFDILAVDAGVTVGGDANPKIAVVQFNAEANRDIQSITTGSSLKGRKSREQVENSKSTYVISRDEENKRTNLLEEKNEVDVSEALQDVDIRDAADQMPCRNAEPPHMAPPDPGDSEKLGFLPGKFWSGPSALGHDLEMEEEIEEDSPSPGSLHRGSGGLVMAWKSNRVTVTVLRIDRQFIRIRCLPMGAFEFLLTAVYAIPSPNCKALLWQELKNLSMTSSGLWVVLGDLNDILQSSERTGGSFVNYSRISIF
ncbi:hypothetical protein K1719_043881 [Acacia pycnantha]|nr:hypothetical protein K1719_043881 [Acacia pycnantha]